MTGRRSHGRLSALNGVVHQGIPTARSSDAHTIRGDSNPRVHKFCCTVHFGGSQLGEALWFVDIVDVLR